MWKLNFTTTLILLGLVIAITSAAPTVDDEIVPEADFIQSEEGAGRYAGGYTEGPLCSSLKRDATSIKIIKGKRVKSSIKCRCKGDKVQANSKAWSKKYNGGAAYVGGPGAKACYIQ